MIRAGRENVIQRALIIETWPMEADAALINQESEETGKLRTQIAFLTIRVFYEEGRFNHCAQGKAESKKETIFYVRAAQKAPRSYPAALDYVDRSMPPTISYSLVSCHPRGLGLDCFLLGLCFLTASRLLHVYYTGFEVVEEMDSVNTVEEYPKHCHVWIISLI